MAQVVVVKDVPAENVADTVEGFKNAGATKVRKKKQDDGKFTVRAEFPD
jgi:hypothetical protein